MMIVSLLAARSISTREMPACPNFFLSMTSGPGLVQQRAVVLRANQRERQVR